LKAANAQPRCPGAVPSHAYACANHIKAPLRLRVVKGNLTTVSVWLNAVKQLWPAEPPPSSKEQQLNQHCPGGLSSQNSDERTN